MASRGPVLTQGRGAAPVAERSSGGLALGEVAWPGMYVCDEPYSMCVPIARVRSRNGVSQHRRLGS